LKYVWKMAHWCLSGACCHVYSGNEPMSKGVRQEGNCLGAQHSETALAWPGRAIHETKPRIPSFGGQSAECIQALSRPHRWPTKEAEQARESGCCDTLITRKRTTMGCGASKHSVGPDAHPKEQNEHPGELDNKKQSAAQPASHGGKWRFSPDEPWPLARAAPIHRCLHRCAQRKQIEARRRCCHSFAHLRCGVWDVCGRLSHGQRRRLGSRRRQSREGQPHLWRRGARQKHWARRRLL